MKKGVRLSLSLSLSALIIFILLFDAIFCFEVNAAKQAELTESPWSCEGHDAGGSGQSPYRGARMNNLKWSYKTDGRVNTSPVIGTDGTIYIKSNDGKVYALNPDGSLKWSYLTGVKSISSPGILADGTIYVGDGSEGKVYALNPDGTLKWIYQVESPSMALGRDDIIYISSDELYALGSDGHLKWSSQTEGKIRTAPAVGTDGTIYIGDMQDIYAFNPDGTLKWTYKPETRFFGSITIGEDDTVYVLNDLFSYFNALYALNPDGTLKWLKDTPFSLGYSSGSKRLAIASRGTIYVVSLIEGANFVYDLSRRYDHYLHAYNLDGNLKWICQMGSVNWFEPPTIYSKPAIGADGTVYVGSIDQRIYAIDPNGSIRWSYKTGGIVSSSPAIGADGTVYVGSDDGRLYAFGGDISCYVDADNDGYGDPDQYIVSLSCPEGYTEDNTDCNDQDDSIYPGAPELDDGKDNDCDGKIDEGRAPSGSKSQTFYPYQPWYGLQQPWSIDYRSPFIMQQPWITDYWPSFKLQQPWATDYFFPFKLQQPGAADYWSPFKLQQSWLIGSWLGFDRWATAPLQSVFTENQPWNSFTRDSWPGSHIF